MTVPTDEVSAQGSPEIPFARPFLGEEEASAAREAILSGWVTQGPGVRAFEEAFARRVGAGHAIAVSSCTTALHLVLHALGIGPGHEVIVPSLSFIATANAVVHTGAAPVFAEVEPEYLTLDPGDVRRRVGPRTRAVLVVDQIGNPADLDAFARLAADAGILLVEDAACAIGSEYRGRPIGSAPWPVCFSFHPRKILTTGDGGMICTSDPALAARLRTLRQHAMDLTDLERHGSRRVTFERYPEVGFNYRMTDIQAAVGQVQLGRLDDLLRRRRELAALYTGGIEASATLRGWLRPHREPPWGRANFQSYAVSLRRAPERRNSLLQALLDRGIHTRRGIMTAHREEAYRRPDGSLASLPVSERASDAGFFLPLYPQMTELEVERVLHVLSEVLGP